MNFWKRDTAARCVKHHWHNVIPVHGDPSPCDAPNMFRVCCHCKSTSAPDPHGNA